MDFCVVSHRGVASKWYKGPDISLSPSRSIPIELPGDLGDEPEFLILHYNGDPWYMQDAYVRGADCKAYFAAERWVDRQLSPFVFRVHGKPPLTGRGSRTTGLQKSKDVARCLVIGILLLEAVRMALVARSE